MTLAFSEVGFAPDFVDYTQAWDLQRGLHDDVVAGKAPSTVLLLEHAAVYTAGKRTEDHERPFDGTPVVPVDRGGKLTWHGPGQLVGYPILALKDPHGIREYVRILEDVIIAVLADYGVNGTRVDGRAGIWIEADLKGPTRKVAAIGIRVHHGVTMHGFAINCSNDLAPFGMIVPCGISDAGVTTIQAETGRAVRPHDLVPRIIEELRNHEAALVASDMSENDDSDDTNAAENNMAGGAAELTQAEGALQ